jgi:hypothetical protein
MAEDLLLQLPLRLHLPLQVPAVILNGVKDPEEAHSPQPFGSFYPAFVLASRFTRGAWTLPPHCQLAKEVSHRVASHRANYSFYFLWGLPNYSFAIFSPKIACQAPEPTNPLPTNNIRGEI